jgi:hypothetical protein
LVIVENLMQLAKTLVVLALAGCGANVALAQTTGTPRIDQRQENQERRIDRGVESGKLNDKEAARLEKGQARVQRLEDKAAADGKVTTRERARIEHKQDVQSARIAKQKHDAQTAKP